MTLLIFLADITKVFIVIKGINYIFFKYYKKIYNIYIFFWIFDQINGEHKRLISKS